MIARSANPARRLIWPALATALACCLLLPFLNDRSIWLDEGYSLAFARLNWPTFWIAIHHLDGGLVFYYALLHEWLVFGRSLATARLLSALFAIAAIPLVYGVTARLFGHATAAATAFLLAINSFYLEYALQARAYSIALFAGAGAMLYFLRLLQQPRWRYAGWLVFFGVFLGVANAPSALLLVALGASLAFYRREGRLPWRQLAVAALLICALLVAFGLFVLHAGPSQMSWIHKPGFRSVAVIARLFAGSKLLAAAFAIAIVIAIVNAIRGPRWVPVAMTLTWLLVPIALLFVLSFVVRPLFLPRYLICTLVPFLMLVGNGLAVIARRPVAAIPIALLVAALSAGPLWTFYHGAEDGEHYRAAARSIARSVRTGDAVALVGVDCGVTFQEAAAQAHVAPIAPVVYPDCAFWLGQPPITAGDVRAWSRHYSRIWIGMRNYNAPFLRAPVDAALATSYRRVKVESFTRISVVRFDRVR